MLFIDFNKGLVIELILFKHLNGFISTWVLNIGSVKLFEVKFRVLILSWETLSQPGLINIFGLCKLLPEFFNLFSQRLVIFSSVFVDLDFHFENFGPFGKHQCGEGVSEIFTVALDVGK